MKRLILTLLTLCFTASCIEADLKGAAAEIADAIDSGSSDGSSSSGCKTKWVLQSKQDGKKNDKNNSDDFADDCFGSDDSYDSQDDSGDTTDDQEEQYADNGDDDVGTSPAPLRNDAVFVGTYEIYQGASDCDYNFPNSTRIFSYDDKLDFLTSDGMLAWTARTFPDDTFDFTAYFENAFGQTTVEVSCTCGIPNSYYYDEAFDCTCEPSNGDYACRMYYKKI